VSDVTAESGDEAPAVRARLDELDRELEAVGIDVGQFTDPGARTGEVGGDTATTGRPTRSGPGSRTGMTRDFRLLWAASALSNLGDGVRLVALPLLATTVTTEPVLIAGVVVAERLPWLVFILPGGAWADRYDRRALRMRLDIARAIVVSALVALVVLDQVSIWAIFAVAALLASAEAVVDSSSVAMVPAAVGHHDLERAAARLGSTQLAMNDLVGPPVGGLLFGVAVAVPFGLDAASFALAALVMAFMTGDYRPRPSAPAGEPSAALGGQIATGFRWLWRQRLLRRLAIVSTGLGTASFISNGVFVLFARETLGLSEFGFGLLLVPSALGGIAGSLVAPRFRHRPLHLVLASAVLTSGAAVWAMSLTSSPWLVGALWAMSMAGIMVWNVLTLALRQRVIPDELLGRVGASYRFLVYLGMPLGALVGGVIADAFGVRSAIFVSGSLLLAIGFVVAPLVRSVGSAAAVEV
jgi:MFS family permease